MIIDETPELHQQGPVRRRRHPERLDARDPHRFGVDSDHLHTALRQLIDQRPTHLPTDAGDQDAPLLDDAVTCLRCVFGLLLPVIIMDRSSSWLPPQRPNQDCGRQAADRDNDKGIHPELH
ncbi:hypothetical protein GCM10009841_29680 [Microlunatus panaciterrae]